MSTSQIRQWHTWLLGWLNHLLGHAPLALMVLLAIASFAIFKQGPLVLFESSPATENQSAGYFLNQFTATEYTQEGKARTTLLGQQAEHPMGAKEMHIEQLSFSADSERTHYLGSARKGLVQDDGKQFTLTSHVVIDKTTPTGGTTHFEGERMVFNANPDTITSDTPVRIQNGKNTFTANSLRYQSADQQIRLNGRVKMTLERR